MPPTVLITFPSVARNRGRHTELLEEAGCVVRASMIERPLTAQEMLPLVGDVDAIIAGGEQIDAQVIAAAPRLRVIARHGVGYDAIDLEAATRAGVVVAITPGTNHISVAELALGLMLGVARRIPQLSDALRKGDWMRAPGVELAGKTLGIVGLGKIGKALATRALALDMRVVAFDVAPDMAFALAHGISLLAFDALLREADFVSLHAPGTKGIPSLIGEPQLRLMKPSAYLINTARGSLVDEDALYRSLVEHRLAGAALDAFAVEPPKSNPLLALDTVLPTPHMGGTIEAGVRTALLATQNALQVLRGESCPHTVNPTVYDVIAARKRPS